MDVQFSPEQQARLSSIAAAQGRATEALVRDAVERYLSYDAWFLGEVDRASLRWIVASSLNTTMFAR